MSGFFIFVLLLSQVAKGQEFSMGSPANLLKNGRFAALIADNYNNGNHFAEIGVVRGYRVTYEMDPSMPALESVYPYFSLSSEFFLGDKFLICPKFGYHYVFGFMHLGLSAFDYTDFNFNKIGLRPEVGLSLGGVSGFCYGYNFTTSNDPFNITVHNFSLKVILKSGLFHQYYKDKQPNKNAITP